MNRGIKYSNISNIFNDQEVNNQEVYNTLRIQKTKKDYVSTADPRVWGPALWLYYHINSVYYPLDPSENVKEHAICDILGIPYKLPCKNCSDHAMDYINSRKGEILHICSLGPHLGEFFLAL